MSVSGISGINFSDYSGYVLEQTHSCETEGKQAISSESTEIRQKSFSVSLTPLSCSLESHNFPGWVLQLGSKYLNISQAVSSPYPNEALILLQQHYFRPDAQGQVYKAMIDSPVYKSRLYLPEYSQIYKEIRDICLPSDGVLRNSPELLDMFNMDWTQLENAKKNRDKYFIEWFRHEMRKMGALTGESCVEFMKRSNFSVEEICHFRKKIPYELHDSYKSNYAMVGSDDFRTFWNFLVKGIQSVKIAFKYNLCPVLYYGDVLPDKKVCSGAWMDTFNKILGLASIGHQGHKDPQFLQLLKTSFPSKEYRQSHPKLLNEYLDTVVFKTCHDVAHASSETAIEILKFLKSEGIDIKSIANSSSHSQTKKFLTEYQI